VPSNRPDRPYLRNWLRRTRRQLAPSGRLSELALILAAKFGRTPHEWSHELRAVLEEEAEPSLELVTEIDAILSRARPRAELGEQALLF
jgi:hypothetical protein